MYSIRIHGRGGQGAKKLSKLIAQSAFIEGYVGCQSFALYGAERRGSAIVSFIRLDKHNPIELRGYITEPDVVIVLDSSLKDIATEGLKENGMFIINTENITISESDTIDVNCIDANQIALDTIGRVITNTCMLGAFAKVTGLFSLENACIAIQSEFGSMPQKIIDKNISSCKAGYEEV